MQQWKMLFLNSYKAQGQEKEQKEQKYSISCLNISRDPR